MKKNSFGRDHSRNIRLARKARRLLCQADTLAQCLPDEFGTLLAEDFAESAIEAASEAIGLLAKIKCSLRIARRKARMNEVAKKIAPHQLAALRMVGTGSGVDILSPLLARTLRDLHTQHPDWIELTPSKVADVAGAKPFFGAILKTPAVELLAFIDGRAA